MTTHHLIVAMSPADHGLRSQLSRTASALGASVAFLQLGSPTLGTELTRLAEAGAERIVLVAVTTSRLSPGVSWLRRIADAWWREHGDRPPQLATAQRLFRSLDELEVLWTEATQRATPVRGTGPGLQSEAWEQVPRHRHQVLVCRGPRCTAAGAERSTEALVMELMRHELGDDDVLITHTGCQFPCNHAPVMSVQPDDVWYGKVDPDTAREIVDTHLRTGVPTGNQLSRTRAR
ncbi:(2Fe-2S) ferredoxin domain-containing protein [Nocardioides sp. Bht2]|uniref:(2Fe-2S) ferredoxin domain-containing protein n=1 Tax=Nocardioides sp. Bht2 TaxID=3392297 RepID=UPI0039B3FECA